MFTISSAKRLFALTAVLFPFDVFWYENGFGWGAYSAFGRYVDTVLGSQFLLPQELFALRDGFGTVSRIAMYAWIVASAVALLATLYLLVTWVVESPLPERRSDRAVGAAFLAAGGLFLLSRLLLYGNILFGSSGALNWYSVPVGAVYMLFVGLVFYRDLFQIGMDAGDGATASANDG